MAELEPVWDQEGKDAAFLRWEEEGKVWGTKELVVSESQEGMVD